MEPDAIPAHEGPGGRSVASGRNESDRHVDRREGSVMTLAATDAGAVMTGGAGAFDRPPRRVSMHAMASAFRPTGIFVPLVTPFREEGDVDLGCLESLTAEVIRDGASGVVALA